MRDLITIPGVGKETKQDLINIGYTNVESLKDIDPEELYKKHNEYVGRIEDRCQLYVFRCAVYYASNETHEKELLKWWNHKEK